MAGSEVEMDTSKGQQESVAVGLKVLRRVGSRQGTEPAESVRS